VTPAIPNVSRGDRAWIELPYVFKGSHVKGCPHGVVLLVDRGSCFKEDADKRKEDVRDG
jgi:hypothetical protein